MLKFIRSTAMKIIIVILVLVFAAFCVAFPKKITTAKNMAIAFYLINEGDKQYSKQDLIGAINYYQRALAHYPYHAKANYNLANIFAVYEDYTSALEYYEFAVLYKPNYMNARIALGILLSEKFFDYDKAIEAYQTAIDKAPFFVNIPLIYKNGLYIKYNKAAAFHNMGLAYKWKSLVYGLTEEESRECLENAVEAYKNAIKYDKKHAYESYFNLALSLQLLGRRSEAKKIYCKCINMRPFDYDAHYNMAILLREEDNFLDALLELEKAALIVETDSDVYKSRYIYDVLNETAGRLRTQRDYKTLKEKLDKDPIASYEPTFINGKIVTSEELDKAMLNNMRTCGACKDDDLF